MRRPFVLLVALAVAACWLALSSGDSQPELQPLLVVGGRGLAPGKLLKPRAVAVDPSGSFYVVDRVARIHRFDSEGRVICHWETPEHEFGAPVGLALEADGSLLVSDSHYSRILRYSPCGEAIIAQWGSLGKGPGQLTWGRDVVVDSKGFNYVGDYGGNNDRILKFSPRGEFVLEWGRQGEGDGEFRKIQGMTIEARGGEERLLVADSANHRIQRFALDGTFLGAFGSVGRGPGQFRFPQSVAVDSAGDIYVCEWGNNRIQKMTPDGEFLGFWGGPGREVGQLHTPWDIEIGPDDRIYVVDYGNHRVQVFRWPGSRGTGAQVSASSPAEAQKRPTRRWLPPATQSGFGGLLSCPSKRRERRGRGDAQRKTEPFCDKGDAPHTLRCCRSRDLVREDGSARLQTRDLFVIRHSSFVILSSLGISSFVIPRPERSVRRERSGRRRRLTEGSAP